MDLELLALYALALVGAAALVVVFLVYLLISVCNSQTEKYRRYRAEDSRNNFYD